MRSQVTCEFQVSMVTRGIWFSNTFVGHAGHLSETFYLFRVDKPLKKVIG